MKTNFVGRQLIKATEGFSPVTYICPAGYKTIGYGHVVRKDEKFDEPISEEYADDLMRDDLARFENAVKKLINVPLNENQFSALVSFAYNVGPGNLQASTLRRKLNRGEYNLAAKEFDRWVFAGGRKLRGLIRRREMERQLFLT